MGLSTSPAHVDEDLVRWHDLECGGYRADLPLWRELADGAEGPVLDVGAGTGRVALELARAGHRVIAVERDAALLSELARRAGRLPVRCVLADARSVELPEANLDLCLLPMQTVQLLGGRAGRRRLLQCARPLLRPGGLLACAISARLEPFDERDGELPAPDRARHGEITYLSHPTALRLDAGQAVLQRRRETLGSAGRGYIEENEVRLDLLDARTLEQEAAALGWQALPQRSIAATSEHVGSTVVMLRA